jgi:hypothetical protein
MAIENIASRIADKMKSYLFTLLLLLCLATCTTFDSENTAVLEPPDINFGVDTTTPDGRVISDPRFAATFVTASGVTGRFDDIGRMLVNYLLWEEPILTAWVYDFESELPIPAESAVFVASPSLVTPRGSGLLAVSDADRASILAIQNNGQVFTWEELPDYLISAFEAQPMSPPSTGGGLGGLLEAER